jgi:hypothetical protein
MLGEADDSTCIAAGRGLLFNGYNLFHYVEYMEACAPLVTREAHESANELPGTQRFYTKEWPRDSAEIDFTGGSLPKPRMKRGTPLLKSYERYRPRRTQRLG